jgi:calmodulin
MFDKDGNGLITKQELLEGLNRLGETMNEKDVLELIEAADLDGDGNINFEEFAELMRQQ